MHTIIKLSFFLFMFIYNVTSFDKFKKLDEFNNWIKEYNHFFVNTVDFNAKFHTWYENDKFIENINNQNLPYKLGHNKFSIYTFDEFLFYSGLNNSFIYNNNKLYDNFKN